MTEENRWLTLALVCMGALLVLLYSVKISVAHDHNQPELDGWYKSLMQPDNPQVSCCGTADAYWCDDVFVKEGKTFCRITDDREDGPLGRPHVPLGTEVEIPDRKLKWDRGNPTGHHVVFLSSGGAVYCFVQATGV